MRKALVRSALSKEAGFKTSMMEAITKFNNGKRGTEEDFEYYIANYYSKKQPWK